MPALTLGRLELRVDEREVRVDGHAVPVNSRAFDVLLALAERHHRVVSKDELLDAAWPGLVVEENNLTVQVSALRKALGADAILTVPGRGYRLRADTGPKGDGLDRPGPRRGNLPATEPTLFGREDDTALVMDCCRARPLVTLCGAGGIGKTALAARVAHRMQASFEHGAWLVELAAVQEPGQVVATIAGCLGLTMQGHANQGDELVRALHGHDMLLVLDNCEHQLSALAPLVHMLAHTAPRLRILATSQEPLHIADEHVVRLAPLAVPSGPEAADPHTFGAVQLFVERVRSLLGRFDPDSAELVDVVEVCRRLDGIALAIEFAAARVPLLGVAGVRDRLDDRLRLLASNSRTAPQRHQTLRAALDWSYQLLGPSTQAVFRRLSICSGGFSLEVAERVAVESDDGEDALEHLAILVDRSLLALEPGRRPRYRMLETTREFALERLADAGEKEATRRRHAHAMRDLCQAAARGRDSGWIWSEMTNARTALAWAIDAPEEGEIAVALATLTAVVLATAGPVPEATANLMRVQHLVDDRIPPPLSAQYWQWVGRLGIDGRMPTSQSIQALERALAMFALLGNHRHAHACRRQLAEALVRSGDLTGARQQLDAATAMENATTPAADRMRRLRVAGLLADAMGAHPEALRHAQAALTLADAHNIERYRLILMADMAWVQLRMGHADAAVSSLQELILRLEPTPRQGLTRAYALAGLTAALVAAGRLQEARRGAAKTLRALLLCNGFMARSDIFAWLAAACGQVQVAAQLLGASDRFHERNEMHRDRIARLAREQTARIVGEGMSPAEASFWSEQGRLADEATLVPLLERAFADGPLTREES